MREKIMYVASLIFLGFSIIVLLGEISIFSGYRLINILGFFLNKDENFTGTWFLSLMPICYLAVCVYYGLFHMKLAGLFGFYKN